MIAAIIAAVIASQTNKGGIDDSSLNLFEWFILAFVLVMVCVGLFALVMLRG